MIKGAREIISDPSRWTQNAYARSESGSIEIVESPKACKFCAMGALKRAAIDMEAERDWDSREEAEHLLNHASRKLYEVPSVMDVNDDIGYEATISVFDEVLKECQP